MRIPRTSTCEVFSASLVDSLRHVLVKFKLGLSLTHSPCRRVSGFANATSFSTWYLWRPENIVFFDFSLKKMPHFCCPTSQNPQNERSMQCKEDGTMMVSVTLLYSAAVTIFIGDY